MSFGRLGAVGLGFGRLGGGGGKVVPPPAFLPNVSGTVSDIFADFTTEGTTNNYWAGVHQRAGFAAWLTALGGTYSRASSATYIAAGLVTTALSGVPRFPGTGLRLTGAQTELTLWNRDLTNAVWTATTATVAKNQTGADGVATSASSITATAGNATVLQAITNASAARIMGAYVKRLTGAGTINITQDNGVTWTAIVPTGAWVFYTLPSATLANPTVGFQIVTNGDAIAVDYVSERAGTFVADVIATTSAAVTQAADVLSFPFSLTTFSALAYTQNQLATVGTVAIIGTDNVTAGIPVTIGGATGFGTYNATAGQIFGPVVAGGMSPLHKTMVSGSPSIRSIVSDNLTVTSVATQFIGSAAFTNLRLGSFTAGGSNPCFGDIGQVAVFSNVVASSAEIKRLTT